MKSKHKSLAWLAASALLLGLGVVLSFWSFRQIEDAAEARKLTFSAIIGAKALQAELIDAETGQRGYALTANAAYLEPYLAVRERIPGDLAALRRLALNSAARKNLDALGPLIEAEMAEMAQVINFRRRQDTDAALALVVLDQGKHWMDAIRVAIDDFTRIERSVLEQDEAQFQLTMRRLFIVIVGASLVALLSAMAFTFLVYRQIDQRLKELIHLETRDLLKRQHEMNAQLQQANATLQASEATLQEAQSLASLGTWSWDLRTERHAWSAEIYRIYGRDPGLAPAPYPQVQDYFPPDSWVRISACVEACLAQGTPYTCDLEVVRADASRRWMSVRGRAERDADGKVVELHGTMQDITDSKLAADELDLHRNHLEQRVASRTAELALASAAAEGASRAKSDFLATMSHEIRTPLNAVVGLTGLLVDSPLDRRQRDCADKLLLSAQALHVLVDDILDFSKIEAGALRLEQAPFSLNAILRTVAAVVAAGMRGKPIEVLFDVAPDMPDALVGDAMRVQQVLLNLTSNAVKFTEAGDIVVTLQCLAREAGRAALQFSVRDTGIGIPAEQLGGIFDVFSQADTSVTRQYGGTGLGLAISARLASLMGGQISVDSVPGQGSEFRFGVTLALADGASAPAPAGAPSPLHILIIDDHPLARDILQRACAAWGWQATALACAADGLEELRRSGAEGRDYDLMLLDWRMPGMDGIEMLRQAYGAADIGLPQVILMASIFELEQAAAASDDLYLDGIVAKPLTPDSLRDAVLRAQSGDFSASVPPSGKTDRRLSGLHLLVAEDNAINQQVIEQILSRAGAEVVIAGGALAAIAALRLPGARFDAVLMDIQMPGMDGHAAARVIREELGLVDVPIIAVTAYALPEDREKSRRAGMLGHIVKPIDVEDLLDILLGAARASPGSNAARPGPARLAPVPAIALAGVDAVAALKAFGGDAKKYTALLRQFIAAHGADADQARRLLDAADQEGAARLVHGLRGMASLLQATDVARLTGAIATGLRRGPAEAVLPLFDELQGALHALGEAMARYDAIEEDV